MVKKLALALALAAGGAHAQIPVTDVVLNVQQVTAWGMQYGQMAEQIQQLVQQYRVMQQQYAAITGGRGMETIAGMTYAQRNYLPDTYAGLMSDPAVNSAMQSNAVLTAAQMAGLSPQQRQSLDEGRRMVAAAQMASQRSYQTTSARFRSLQTLIDSIGSTPDTKAIADLQGRIAGEQAMLANEQSKAAALSQAFAANQLADEQLRRERAVQSTGDIRTIKTVTY
jgi:type IV secretion system protein VirB5